MERPQAPDRPLRDTRSTPCPVDLSHLDGVTVLGESLAVLYSALLRLQFSAEREGMAEISATWPNDEAEAIERAMARSEREFPGDRRTAGQRDYDRFMAVVERVGETAQAVWQIRGQGAA